MPESKSPKTTQNKETPKMSAPTESKPTEAAKAAKVAKPVESKPVAPVNGDSDQLYTGPDMNVRNFFKAIVDRIQDYKVVKSKLDAADGDRNSLIKSWIETSDNPQAVKLRETIAKANAELKALAEQNVKDVTLSESDKEKLQAELKELKEAIKLGRKTVVQIAETTKIDVEGAKAALERLQDPTRSNRGRQPGDSAGAGVPRVSATVYVKGGKLDQEFSTFSAAAMAMSAEVVEIQKAFAEAAGVKHQDIKTVNKPVEFSMVVGDTTYNLKTTPKQRKPRSDSKAA